MEVGYVHINTDARGDQKRALELPDMGAGSQILQSSGRAV